jgi:hypothetical protein
VSTDNPVSNGIKPTPDASENTTQAPANESGCEDDGSTGTEALDASRAMLPTESSVETNGISGGLHNRPRKLPFSGHIAAIFNTPCPMAVRQKLENALGYTEQQKKAKGSLPERFTWGEAHLLTMNLASQGLAGGLGLEIFRESLEMIEGDVQDRVKITENGDVPQTVDEVKKVIYGKFAELAIERAREFRFPLHGIQELADEVGIGDKLGIPREDPHRK